mgnify:CR=1 FL=1
MVHSETMILNYESAAAYQRQTNFHIVISQAGFSKSFLAPSCAARGRSSCDFPTAVTQGTFRPLETFLVECTEGSPRQDPEKDSCLPGIGSKRLIDSAVFVIQYSWDKSRHRIN